MDNNTGESENRTRRSDWYKHRIASAEPTRERRKQRMDYFDSKKGVNEISTSRKWQPRSHQHILLGELGRMEKSSGHEDNTETTVSGMEDVSHRGDKRLQRFASANDE